MLRKFHLINIASVGLVIVLLIASAFLRKNRERRTLKRLECVDQLLTIQMVMDYQENAISGQVKSENIDDYVGALMDTFLNLGEGWRKRHWSDIWRIEKKFTDPWGRQYNWDFRNGAPLFWSSGPNGVSELGSGDDLMLGPDGKSPIE